MVKAVKLADIAEKVGVSVVTVSKALSGQKGVSEEMRARIKDLADEMGYTPIHAVQTGRTRSYTIGVITFEKYFTRFASFYWKMYQELATRAVKKNCFSMLEVISNYDEENLVWPKLITENQKIDGIIIIGRPKISYLKMLYQNKKIPMVFMDFYDDEEVVDSVVSASFNGMYRMTDYLIKNGHTKVAFVGTVMFTESITDRYFGYCKALMEHGIEVRQDWIIKDRDYNDGVIGVEYRLQLPKEMPTAFVCNNDVTAYALIRQLEERNYRVPEDVSVVGYDDYLYPEYGDSKITTYLVDMAEMSKIALSCIIRRIENISMNASVHIVNGRIIERMTVKKLNEK
ncbi:MAG: LacI family DNA-binding transcriptional regulator [Lachnospiraceae bacterium]|nr:LacI family DNA-binding transcriptional regulator [Lachnospiraceae bacterium]MDE7418262.1 LacI family DNA-binding transcriptional regulator [Lachnospiraceae bacterium]